MIAAVAACLTLLVLGLTGRRAEVRAAHRAALGPHLDLLAEGVQGVVEDLGGHPGADPQAPGVLQALRPHVRYTLHGLDDPLRVLAQAPGWAQRTWQRDGRGWDGAAGVRDLADAVDAAVRRSYGHGVPPGPWSRRSLARRASLVEREARVAGLAAVGPAHGRSGTGTGKHRA